MTIAEVEPALETHPQEKQVQHRVQGLGRRFRRLPQFLHVLNTHELRLGLNLLSYLIFVDFDDLEGLGLCLINKYLGNRVQ
jgi:hypothetical protein